MGLIYRTVATYTGLIILILSAALLGALYFPLIVLRRIIKKLQKVFKPNFYKILPCTSAVWMMFGIYDNPTSNVIISIKFEGKLDFEEVKRRLGLFLLARNSSGGFVYPEFQMRLVKWFGYWFWEPEQEFQLDQHLSYSSHKIHVNEEEEFMMNFEKHVLWELFPSGLSPWKIVCVENLVSESEKPCWYLQFKFHHAMADGFSIFNAFMSVCADNYQAEIETPPAPRGIIGKVQKLIQLLKLILSAPYDVGKSVLDSSLSKPWVLPLKKAALDRIIVKSSRISSSAVKNICSTRNVSFFAGVLAILTAGIRRILLQQQSESKNGKIAKYISTTIPVPWPGRTSGLVNHFTAIMLNLPIAEAKPTERLQICDQEIISGKSSILPFIFPTIFTLGGLVPTFLTLTPKALPGLQITCFPGPKQQISMNGQKVVDMHFNACWRSGNSAVILCVLTYNGGIRVVANADKAAISSKELLQELITGIEQEVSQLLAQEEYNGKSDQNNNIQDKERKIK